MRGGEFVLEQLCQLYPDADIYTHICDPAAISERLRKHRITETFVAKLPMARRHYQKYLTVMPRALEELDLTSYDLVISSESGPAKGVVTRPDTPHICYVHSPMRYIWDLYPQYRDSLSFPAKQVFSATAHWMRQWDYNSAQRLDRIVANSNFVADRVRKYWAREATVLNPPVDLSRFAVSADPGDEYLFVSELVPYKRADLAVEAFRRLGKPLTIVGSGSEFKRLKATAPANVTFAGRVDNDELAALYARCRALIFPGEEDFGIVPLEAMASGRPVIAYGRGGALDTVKPGLSGLFFHQQTPEALVAAVEAFEARGQSQFNAAAIAAHAQSFNPRAFRQAFAEIVEATMQTAARPLPQVTQVPPPLRTALP